MQGNEDVLPNIFALTGSEVELLLMWMEGIAGGRASSGIGTQFLPLTLILFC